MVTANLQKQQFQDRLKRISAGGENTMSQVYAGPVEDAQATRAKPRKGGKARARGRGARPLPKGLERALRIPGDVAGGLLLGVLAIGLVRYARFRLTGSGLGGPDADIWLLSDMVLAIALAIALRSVIRVRSRPHEIGKLIGVAAMALLMQDMVFLAPGLFDRVFSPQWVDMAMGIPVDQQTRDVPVLPDLAALEAAAQTGLPTP